MIHETNPSSGSTTLPSALQATTSPDYRQNGDDKSAYPLLTIAIPTYNRSHYLKQLLTGLAPQLANESQVELIISDNASPDETPSVVESFRSSDLKCRYIRNDENMGADRNFLQCLDPKSAHDISCLRTFGKTSILVI